MQISDILGARQHAHENGQAGKKTPRLDEEKASGSVFSALLDSDLPSAELSLERLQHEAISIIGAGLETTMRALSLATFHVADNPPVQQRLRAELAEAFPDPGDVPSWENLQRLPYLSACIEESESHDWFRFDSISHCSTASMQVARRGLLPHSSEQHFGDTPDI